jgi:L-alanine-DL-glutamate epimerase-like enolase superfamily enzyme
VRGLLLRADATHPGHRQLRPEPCRRPSGVAARAGYHGHEDLPFDYAAERKSGHWIAADELRHALVPFEKIRKAVGDRMDIAAELHSLWSRPQAIKIAQALEPLQPMWMEDPVFTDHLNSIGEVARATRVPIGSLTPGVHGSIQEEDRGSRR